MQDEKLERFILVVDHHCDHAATISQALSPQSGQHRLQVVESGAIALAFLRQQGEYATAPRPDLILLEQGLPDNESLTLLTAIKTDPHLRRIPVIVLAESERSEDVFQSYFSQGNCYVVKAHDLPQLAETVKRIESFWLEIVTLPGV